MNLTKILTISLLLLSACTATKKSTFTKDSYSKSEIDKIAEWKYGYDLDSTILCDFYILDGIPYDNSSIDSILAQLKKTDIGYVIPVVPGKEQTWFHKQCDLFMLIGTNKQSINEKTEILNSAQNLFNEQMIELRTTDHKCDKCPILSINGKIVQNPHDRKFQTNKLTPNKIKYIVQISQKLNPEYYGTNYENGIIEITLK